MEKLRRKLEGDLKTTQEQVETISHAKDELEKALARSASLWYSVKRLFIKCCIFSLQQQ